MKHLKRYNESISNDDVLDFCETGLAYLLDDGVIVKVSDYYEEEKEVQILFYDKMTWNECKDQVIPFLTRLINKYELSLITNDINLLVSTKTDKGRVDVAVSNHEIKNIDQIMTEYPLKFLSYKKTGFDFIIDKLIFYVKSEK